MGIRNHAENTPKGRATGQAITRRGLRIYQNGDQIKTIDAKNWDVASQSTDGNRSWVRFALKSHV